MENDSNPEFLRMAVDLIFVLCGEDQASYDYVIRWIALLFQQPEAKSTLISFSSEEGTGKGTLLKLLRKIMGVKKVLETSAPSMDCWGPFNELMVDAFLVSLNELETCKSEHRLKMLTSDDMLNINPKGTKAYQMKSYHKFIVFTNKDSVMKTSKGDRRKLFFMCSDKYVGNREYWNKWNADLEAVENIRTFYDYLMELDLTEFNVQDLVVTDYHEDLIESYGCRLEAFVKDLVIENCDDFDLTKTLKYDPSQRLQGKLSC